MAKNKRKRKLKEQDFQKVKLRIGKKLQPAQNATDTSFKSRSIFIPSQLQQKLDSEPTNQRNQSLKDLLSQVGHYSVTTRQEALVGLKDLFQRHEYLLQENLGIVIKRVAEKMTDSDPSVRQSLLLLLCFVFPLVPQERMAPFSPLVTAHLSCAMTHIYDDIQHDSLGFLELCLRYFPDLMVTSSSQLIQNFVGMISHQTTSGTKMSKGLQHKAGKGLSVNPKGKLSSLRSRLKVLQQLLAFLKALESSTNSFQGRNPFSSRNHVDLSSKKPVFHLRSIYQHKFRFCSIQLKNQSYYPSPWTTLQCLVCHQQTQK
ncbi:Testis-expressed sequence 10 protein [Desmophyllum pertusum]|uniref:Testis-expressed sequence 10 protein n=1 Tax=Desmophyllum pertusum TaxID=174260 RepID=A0A9W9YMU0_9CNID|nr:Testis-expressed sequence 10 protein [Desmophyllum pertusum]